VQECVVAIGRLWIGCDYKENARRVLAALSRREYRQLFQEK
jgi:hypothetical protein